MTYSMPRILLGAFKSVSVSFSGNRAATARALAAGKEQPCFRKMFNRDWYWQDSLAMMRAQSEISDRSPHSLPKCRESTTPSLSIRDTAPWAKYSALPSAKYTGSSKTRSAPFASAIWQRWYLSTMAGIPRCMKSPLRTTTIQSACSAVRMVRSWYKCPLWNGLYSAMTAVTFIYKYLSWYINCVRTRFIFECCPYIPWNDIPVEISVTLW